MMIEIFLMILAWLVFLYSYSCYKGESKTKMYWRRNKRNSSIITLCKNLQDGFQPTFWARNSHFQTIIGFAGYFTHHKFNFRKKCILTRDGGTISFDWYQKMTTDCAKTENVAGTRPLLVICGWMLGPDIEDLCQLASNQGYQPVTYNSRGQDIPLTSNQLAAYLDADDFSQAVNYLHAEYPFSDIHAVGYSLGCAPILGYIALKGKSSKITSSVLISTTLDLESLLNIGLKKPYHYAAIEKLKQLIVENHCLHSVLDIADIQSSKSLRDIYQRAHSMLPPYQTYREYVEMNNPLSYIKNIRSPTLFINSSDDPVIDDQIPAYIALRNNSYCVEVVTETGGHCGFATGFLAHSWANKVAIEFHDAVSRCKVLLLSPMKNGFTRLRSETR